VSTTTPSAMWNQGAEDYVGRLAGDAGDAEKFRHGLRDFAVELFGDDAACALTLILPCCGRKPVCGSTLPVQERDAAASPWAWGRP